MKRTFFSLLMLIALSFSLHRAHADTILHASDYGITPESPDNMQALQRLLQQQRQLLASSEAVTLEFTPGDYHFSFAQAPERTIYVSNHDQTATKRIAFDLRQMQHLTIDGKQARFLFSGIGIPFALENSSDLILSHLTIDYVDPQITEIKVLENTPDGIRFKVSEPNPWHKKQYELTPEGQFKVIGQGWSNTPMGGIAFEGDTHHILYNTGDVGADLRHCVRQGSTFFAPQWKDSRMKAGTILALRDWSRPTPAIWIAESQDIAIRHVNIHYANGMAIIAQRSKDLSVTHTQVVPSKGRVSTSQADATHFVQCQGNINETHCVFTGMMDDAINIHGIYLRLTERIDAHTGIFSYKHYQAWGFPWGDPGDKVRFITSKNMQHVGNTNRIQHIEPADTPTSLGAKSWKITFTEALPDTLDGVENLTWTPSAVFSHNIIRNNRARGSLFSSCRAIVCSHNLFDHTSGSAILIAGDCNGWYESGPVEHVVISHNKFIDALTSRYQFTNGIISIYPEIPNIEQQTQAYHKNIVIAHNLFSNFPTPLVYAHSVEGIVFSHNRIKYNKHYAPLFKNTSPFVWGKNVSGFVEAHNHF